MKLRRAMAVAAATAVIAPAAFLAAPAAYASTGGATGTPGTAGAGTTTTGGTTTGGTTTGGTTTGGGGQDGPAPETASTPSADASAPAGTEDAKPSGTDADAKNGDKKPASADTPAPGGKQDGKGTDAQDGKDDEGDEEFPDCEEAAIEVGLGGFPNKIVAGSGWKNFTFHVKNTGEKNIGELNVYAAATYGTSPEEGDERLIEKYAHFEYKDPETGKWVNDFAESPFNNGMFFGQFPLDAGQKVTVDLRVKIDKGAPAGKSVMIAAGGYDAGAEDDENAACFENGDVYPFTIVKPGAKADDVDDAKPSGEKPSQDLKPQGEAKPLPVTGNLAETGSSSMLPTIGIAGGIAVVAGAGVVFALKRRRSDATA